MTANPFKPTAGKMPPQLLGRERIIQEFIDGLNNGAGAPERLMRISGSRGTGKTVMLNELRRIAVARKWAVIDETASAGFNDRILASLQPKTKVDRVTIQPSALGISLGEAELSRATLDLRQAIEKKLSTPGVRGLLITLDEIQDASMDEVRSLAIAVQHSIGADLNIAFVFAGLPSIITDVTNGKTLTFLRRATPENMSEIDEAEIAASFTHTTQQSGLRISSEVAKRMAQASAGFAFLIQLVGYYSWQTAYRQQGEGAEITADDCEAGINIARSKFTAMAIEPELQRLPPSQLAYLLAASTAEGDVITTSHIAETLGKNASELSTTRNRLIKASILHSPGYGKIGFQIPYMREYLQDNMDDLASSLPAELRGGL
jgi:hypothetical protein